MKSNDFDRVAFIYDRLARLIFGKDIIESQTFFLNKIAKDSSVLILGGGSGWILEKILQAKPSVNIFYVEASANMISLAKDRMRNNKQIQFIHGTEKDISDQQFDVVITNFYLDLFEDNSLNYVLQKIKNHVAHKAIWIVTDFVNESWVHGLMLKTMYVFFRLTSRIEASKLPDWRSAAETVGARKVESKLFYGKFIETVYFQF